MMIQEGSSSSSWPSGFDDQSPDCEVDVEGGGASRSCSFQIVTPSNLDSAWEGCVFVIEVGMTVPMCPDTDQTGWGLQIEVEPKGIGLDSLGLGDNQSISDIVIENKGVVAGGAGVLVLLAVIVSLLRRSRRNRYED